MNSFLLFIGENETFEEERAVSAILSIASRPADGNDPVSLLVCEYNYLNDSTIIRLDKNLQTISVVGSGVAAMNAALLIQKKYESPLRMVDLDYSFDINLQSITSLEALRNTITAALNEPM